MSTVLTPEAMELLKSTIRDTLMELLPALIKEVTPIISAIVKDLTPVIMKGAAEALNEVNAEQTMQQQQRSEADKLFNDFVSSSKQKLDEILARRYKSYITLATMDTRRKLYDESLQKTPVYIPKKYRKDSFYVHDEEELSSVTKFEMQRFVSEYEILSKRRNHILAEITKTDEEAFELIKNANLTPELEEKAAQRWKDSAEKDKKKVDNLELKKEKSTREAYAKDEIFWKKHQVDRLKNKGSASSELSDDADGMSIERDTSEWVKAPEVELVVVPDEASGQGPEVVNENSKNGISPKPAQPPDPAKTTTTEGRRTSPRNSSISHPKT